MKIRFGTLVLSLILTLSSQAAPALADDVAPNGTASPAATGTIAPAADMGAADKKPLIQELLDVSRATRNAELGMNLIMDAQLRGMNSAIKDRIDQQKDKTDAQKAQEREQIVAKVDGYMKRFQALMLQEVNLKQLVQDTYSKLYDQYYTKEDIQNILAYYRSKTGQRMLDIMPQLTQDAAKDISATTMDGVKRAAAKLQAEIQADVAAEKAAAEKAGGAKSVTEKEAAAMKEAAAIKDGSTAKDSTAAKDNAATKDSATEKSSTATKDSTSVKGSSAAKNASAAKNKAKKSVK